MANYPAAMEDLLPLVQHALENACSFGEGCPTRLGDAMRYALLAPGKRLRPALVLMACEACGGKLDEALPAAVAVEMIHAYSLVHDDLPAMDDDDLRRGRPTVHIQFDEATAILVGDALQAQAFVHLGSGVKDPARAIETIRVLAQAAGASQLVGGQSDDLSAERGQQQNERGTATSEPRSANGTVEHLESIHRRKTGALFSASLEMGAILAGGDQKSRQVLSNYASDLGLAFQVVDDLLDFTADEQTLGKRTGKDVGRGKLTYPGLLGIEAARAKAEQLVESARSHALFFGPAGWRLTSLADYVLERTQ
ncbi:Farnesyl diphosphate synthase [Novipirellula galeiformis]|uniref:Farnesyl diphosphate synthase n=1 Tax=Novipirellula galeiformis TaxID=2528004 RepID=A0A5C6CAN5_9BACT|nr:farnesyl diphosphate synthase [Novipirellula galeiformis]TWU21017.1 Farnesyl diphosphate synthase [Novipirellula galeiformis]